MVIGTLVGLVSGFFEGWTARVLYRFTEWFLVMPFLLLAMVMAAVLGRSLLNIVLVIGVTSWPSTALLIRSQTLSIKERPYLERARVLGAGRWHQMTRHVLPNVMPMVFANTTLTVSVAILTETTLSFLGLGDPTRVSWGSMLDDAFNVGAMTTGAWWFIIPPGSLRGRWSCSRSTWSARRSRRSSTPGCGGGEMTGALSTSCSTYAGCGGLPDLRGRRCPPCAASTWSCGPGEVVGVAGESGCGKSTLASTVLRLQPPGRHGRRARCGCWGRTCSRWAGATCAPCAGPRPRSSSRVRCTRSTPCSGRRPDRRADPAARAGAVATHEVEERVGALLEQVGLPRARARAYPHQLSGGSGSG